MAVDLSKAFNRLDHGKLLTILHDMGVPTCALRLLRSYLTGRTMQVHLSDAVSTVYELWGGGPQGGLLTVLLFNINSNWITDLCQPGFSKEERFLSTGRVVFPRCTFAQQRDCPPDVLGQAGHVCKHRHPCDSWPSGPRTTGVLNPEAEPFFLPSAGTSVQTIPSSLRPSAAPFIPGVVVHVLAQIGCSPSHLRQGSSGNAHALPFQAQSVLSPGSSAVPS